VAWIRQEFSRHTIVARDRHTAIHGSGEWWHEFATDQDPSNHHARGGSAAVPVTPAFLSVVTVTVGICLRSVRVAVVVRVAMVSARVRVGVTMLPFRAPGGVKRREEGRAGLARLLARSLHLGHVVVTSHHEPVNGDGGGSALRI
jgi:hypothetical protein